MKEQVEQHLPQSLLVAHDPFGQLGRDLELDREILVHGVDLVRGVVRGAVKGAVRGVVKDAVRGAVRGSCARRRG